MIKFSKVSTVALAMMLPLCMNAQSNGDFESNVYLQVQGGAQLPFSPGTRSDLISPNFGANLGIWLSPAMGFRVGAEGLKSKVFSSEGYYIGEFHYKNKYNSFKYYNVNVDLLCNLTSFFTDNLNTKNRLYLFGGVGLAIFGDQDLDTRLEKDELSGLHNQSHNLRVGLGYEYQLARPFSVSAEFRLNNAGKMFDGLSGPNNRSDWRASLLLGVAYHFAYKTSKEYSFVEPVQTVSAPLSLYEQKEQEVNARMTTWMKRIKDESKEDFALRTTDKQMEAQRLEYSKIVSTDMAGNRINTNVRDLQYSNSKEMLGVRFTDMPAIAIKVPRADVASIKNVQDMQFTNTVYNLNPGDKFEVLYTDVINPATGKKYTYVKEQDVQYLQTDGYLPLSAIHQDMENNTRLQRIKDEAVREANEKNILSDNTTISVATELIPTANGQADYKITYKYTVKDGFSVHDDFAPGKYDASKSPASTAMLKIIKESMSGEFAKYCQSGKAADIKYSGSADASPINGKIAYNGMYGDIVDQAVMVSGRPTKLSVTKQSGITTNEQLSLLRAISVKNYIHNNVPALNNLKVTESYNVDVASEEGSEFRRVVAEFLFHDVLNK